MSAELAVINENITVSSTSETTEDVKNVILQQTSVVGESTLTSAVTTNSSVPFKSSSEILSELFSAFNAEPPTIPDTFDTDDGSSSNNLPQTEALGLYDEIKVSNKTPKLSKNQKSRHKHKNHKHKKKRKKYGTEHDLSSADEGCCSPLTKKIKKEKESEIELGLNPCPPDLPEKPRQRHKSRYNCSTVDSKLGIKKENVKTKHRTSTRSRLKIPLSHDSGTTLRSVKFNKGSESSGRLGLGLSIKISNNITYDGDSNTDLILESESQSQPSNLSTEKINCPINLPKEIDNIIATKIKVEPGTEPREQARVGLPAVNKETCVVIGQSKTCHKISIKSLKNSSVFEATVRQVEEQAKAKADRYEEGEISNSDSEKIVLSPISSEESDGNIEITSCDGFYNTTEELFRLKKHRKKHRSVGHHHSSRHRQKSSEHGKGFLILDKHSHKTKHKKRNETEKRVTKELGCKHQHTHRVGEKHRKKSCSCSLSPEHVLLGDKPVGKLGAFQQTSVQGLCNSLRKRVGRSTLSEKKTVEELTDFCKELSKKECCDRSDECCGSDSETEQPFCHPFQLRERPQSIILNIRNSIQLPVKSLQEKAAEQTKQLRHQFPVSSGQHHRKVEDEWVPVSSKQDSVVKHTRKHAGENTSTPGSVLDKPACTSNGIVSVNNSNANPYPALGTVSGVTPVKDIGNIVSQKLRAMRTLQENPNDVEALGAMYHANQDMMHWAEAKQYQVQLPTAPVKPVPVAVTASAGVSSGGIGMGMSLLQKMGWKPGEGLGKNREGTLEPLKLEMKMDKKGLITAEDLKGPPCPLAAGSKPGVPNTHTKFPAHNVNESVAKHPINQLVELCMRNRWKGPQFELCHESGPDHRKNFLFKVMVNGTEYKPMVTSLTKKQAKSEAAGVCLQALRFLRP